MDHTTFITRSFCRHLRKTLDSAERNGLDCGMRFPHLTDAEERRLHELKARICLKVDDQGQQHLGLWQLVRDGHRPIPLTPRPRKVRS